ncbi:MAG TPA: hypothetical protein VFI27_12375 [candidate division Zixibacteria bacterium]|nr:hypothetical protein [candidate division Zixibacteria bacterium]
MGENSRPTGVSVIAVFFVLTAIPSLAGTVHFIVNGLAPVLSDGIGEGLFVNVWAFLLGIVATLFYGVLALGTAYGLWSAKGWSRSMAIFLSVFLLFIFPVGTIIGAIIIWYLRKQEVKDTFVDAFMF